MCAHLFERTGDRLDIGICEVLREVPLDSLAVMSAAALHRLGALVGEDDENPPPVVLRADAVHEAPAFCGRARCTSPASSIRSTARVNPLLLYRIRPASAFIGMPSGDSSRWTRTSYQRIGIPTASSSSASSRSVSASELSKNRRQTRSRSGEGVDIDVFS